MNNKIIPLLLIVIVIGVVTVSGCVGQNDTIKCQPSWINTGPNGCCPDKNNNSICDSEDSGVIIPVSFPGVNKTFTPVQMSTVIYQSLRKWIPQSTIGSFVHDKTIPNMKCGEFWYYPSTRPNISEVAITSKIEVCGNDEAYTPQYILSISSGFGTSERYIKTLRNGDILITDKKSEFTSSGGRYDFEMYFTCLKKYGITISTQSFYGDAATGIYKTYTIDKVAFENMVGEILEQCKQAP